MKKRYYLFTAALVCAIVSIASPAKSAPAAIHYQGQVSVGGTTFDGTGYFKFAIVDDGTEHIVPASATASVTNGFLTAITVVEAGNGYVEAPEIEFSGSGTGAAAEAVVENGKIVAITVTAAGSGYMTAPSVSIATPPGATIQTLWSNVAGAVTVNGATEPNASVALAVNQGVFSVPLGDSNLTGMAALRPEVFKDSPAFLRIWFSPDNDNFEQLTPDQPVLSVPYAMHAMNVADGAITADSLQDGAVTSNALANRSVTSQSLQDGAVRGRALDLQTLKVGQNHTILNLRTVALGGYGNSVSQENSAALGGSNNTASGRGAATVGGSYIKASGWSSAALGGSWNVADGQYSVMLGGSKNETNQDKSAVLGGYENKANAEHSVVIGGSFNKADGESSIVLGD